MPDFLPPIAYADAFPPPLVPPAPVLDRAALLPGPRDDRVPSLAGQGLELTASGRAALARIAQACVASGRRRALLPAYHCPSMVEPFAASGCDIDFFHVDAELRPERADFDARLGDSPDLVVLVHYFGFANGVDACAALARSSGALVVHDCAHALFDVAGVPPEDAAVASLTKFLAAEEGGLVRWPDALRRTAPLHRAGGVVRELRTLSRMSERAARAGSWIPAGWLGRMAGLAGRLRRSARRPPVAAPQAAGDGFRYFVEADRNRAPSAITTLLARLQLGAAVYRRRRENYEYLCRGFGAFRFARPLYPELTDHVVPYVLPIVLERGNRDFVALRESGVPLYRWEELSPTDCTTSMGYRERLVQVPCHQGLSRNDLDRILAAARAVLDEEVPRG